MDSMKKDSQRRDAVDEESRYTLQQDDFDDKNIATSANSATIERITMIHSSQQQESQDCSNDEMSIVVYDDDDDDSVSVVTPKPRHGCLPEVEELPVNQIMAHLEYCDQDLAWSFLSNTCFMMGGIAYVVQSTWDCFDDDPQTIWYRLLDSIAPAIYVVNSIVDTEWAMKVKKKFNINEPQDWGKLSVRQFYKVKGGSLLSYYKGSLFGCLKSVYTGFFFLSFLT